MSDEILNQLLKEYSETHHKMVDACKSIDEQIMTLQEGREMIAEPWEEILNDVESKIHLIMNDRKSSFKSDYGKINFRKGTVRRTYNADALDNICAVNEYVKTLIWAHRKETIGEPSIQINLIEV